ncbi:hypothetical protein THYS13_12810 [Thermoanaerobacter sp. YS13]|uniref:hypothetical protein n=1 Tax=Thermoanaerobacter sp. YS13 TaxID=1511746 RepID=UPI00057560EC|nr:hypothetical protein [Thermoanaerobacter sp. YS13]KHO63168.1 hypothetical protein THYS13_12810 [Thermoanaerobacter sp. YS13]
MKVGEFINKHSLEELYLSVLKKHDDNNVYLILFMTDEKGQIKKKYRDFYDALKKLTPDKNIKGRIIFDSFSGRIIEAEDSKNERLEFLSWEEVLALDTNINEDNSPFEKLFFIDYLLYLITMHGKAFDLKTKKKIEYEEKTKENLIPKVRNTKEKLLYFLKEVLYIFKSPFTIPVLLAGITVTAKYIKPFVYVLATLIDADLSTIPTKLLITLGLFTFWYLSFSAYNKIDSYLDQTFKTKLKKNIEEHLKNHPEDSVFLNTEYFESFKLAITLKENF